MTNTGCLIDIVSIVLQSLQAMNRQDNINGTTCQSKNIALLLFIISKNCFLFQKPNNNMICCNTYEKLFYCFCLFVSNIGTEVTTFFAWLGFLVLNLGSTKDYCGILLRILDCEARQPSTTRHAYKCLSDISITTE